MKQLILSFLLVYTVHFSAQNKSKFGVTVIDEYKYYQNQLSENPEHEMINLKTVKGVILDIRYATTNNFTNAIVYEESAAFVRKPLVAAISSIVKELKENGLALKVYDAYRPYDATVKFYELIGDTQYVASPYTGSRHNRGCAIDITLVHAKNGMEVEMPTAYDDFTKKAHPNYNGDDISIQAKENRELLIALMEKNGFKVYPSEWWHFDFIGWENYPIMNLSFEELKQK